MTNSIPWTFKGSTFDIADDFATGLLIRKMAEEYESDGALAAAVDEVMQQWIVHETAFRALSGCGVTGGTKCGTAYPDDGRRIRCPAAADDTVQSPSADNCPTAPRDSDLNDLVTEVINSVAQKSGATAVVDADAISRAARRRWAEHAIARIEDRADPFGMDPADRQASSAGRYDGSL